MENKAAVEERIANFKVPDSVSMIVKEIKKITDQTIVQT